MARFVAWGTTAPSAAVMHFDADDRLGYALDDPAYRAGVSIQQL